MHLYQVTVTSEKYRIKRLNEYVYADKIVTPVVDTTEWSNGAVMPWTVTVGDKSSLLATALAMKKNKCPFLRTDHLCNIYENRPEICRLYGEIDELKCKYRK